MLLRGPIAGTPLLCLKNIPFATLGGASGVGRAQLRMLNTICIATLWSGVWSGTHGNKRFFERAITCMGIHFSVFHQPSEYQQALRGNAHESSFGALYIIVMSC